MVKVNQVLTGGYGKNHRPHILLYKGVTNYLRIGIIAVDGHNGFPNLALMRLSAWHKQQGDTVEWWNGFERYDRVYMSKVFTFTQDFNTAVAADEVITGGTGYKDYRNLPSAFLPEGVGEVASGALSLAKKG